MNDDNKQNMFIPRQRQAFIYTQIQKNGAARVSELAEALNVTEMTVRRDLEILERKGMIERTHGGAILNSRIGLEPRFAQKSSLFLAEKQAIGKAAALLIEEGDTIFVNSGTTTIEFLKNLKTNNVHVITNNPMAPINTLSENVHITMTGGEIRRESFTLVGELAIKALKNVYASKAVISVDGFSIKHGLTNAVENEAWINRLMIMRTHGMVILVADSSKLGKVAAFKLADITSVSVIVTDQNISATSLEEFDQIGIKVITAEL
ncbi:MAG: DeoR/GlpR family DNA-binding transcription regulator [Rectinema sp.]